MQNHEKRIRGAKGDLARRAKSSPLSTLYGFLCQWNAKSDSQFNPLKEGNDRASALFARLVSAADMNTLVTALRDQMKEARLGNRWFWDELHGHVGDLLNANRVALRSLRAELRFALPATGSHHNRYVRRHSSGFPATARAA